MSSPRYRGRRLARPRARHHQRGAGGQPLRQALVDADVGGVARAEVVAVDDEQAVVGLVAEPFGERRHGATLSATPPVTGGGRAPAAARRRATSRWPTRTPATGRGRLAGLAAARLSSPRWATFGGIV